MKKKALLVAMREIRQIKSDAKKSYKEEKLIEHQFIKWIEQKLAQI